MGKCAKLRRLPDRKVRKTIEKLRVFYHSKDGRLNAPGEGMPKTSGNPMIFDEIGRTQMPEKHQNHQKTNGFSSNRTRQMGFKIVAAIIVGPLFVYTQRTCIHIYIIYTDYIYTRIVYRPAGRLN